MKKRKLLCIIILFHFTIVYSTNYKIIKKTSTFDGDGYPTKIELKENLIVKLNNLNIINTQTYSDIPFDFGVFINRSGNTFLIDVNNIIPENTTDLFADNIISYNLEKQGKRWIPKTELDILYSNNRDTYFQLHSKKINNYENNIRGKLDNPWYEDVYSDKRIINNLFLTLYDGIKYHFTLKILNIKRNNQEYLIQTEVSEVLLEDSDYQNDILNNLSNRSIITIRFYIDGDYLFIKSENNVLLFTFILVNQNVSEQYENLMHLGNCDLSRVTWPRHADGSCDYDGSKKTVVSQTTKTTPTTNVSINKTMTVKENLKLRSGEATTTQVLTVMSAGTKVKILELGKAETIDGINSNWVKVEVQAGAKDRDGKPIKTGTVGWCYGGYLK